MDCIIYSKLHVSGPCVGRPVQMRAMHRLCSSGLSPHDGGGGEQSHRWPFLP